MFNKFDKHLESFREKRWWKYPIFSTNSKHNRINYNKLLRRLRKENVRFKVFGEKYLIEEILFLASESNVPPYLKTLQIPNGIRNKIRE